VYHLACSVLYGLATFFAMSFHAFLLLIVATGLLAGLPSAGIRRPATGAPGGPGEAVPKFQRSGGIVKSGRLVERLAFNEKGRNVWIRNARSRTASLAGCR
jgi:hypothetical protein